MKSKIVVIGAGVSSLALCSMLEGDIHIFEKNDFAGRKLLATGNGRCNLTNVELKKEHYYSSRFDLVWNIISQFDNKKTIEYFNELGLFTTTTEQGRVYPVTMQSQTVRDIMYLKAVENGGKFYFGENVRDINPTKKLIVADKKTVKYDVLIIAVGGLTLKNSGSDGNLYDVLRKFFKFTPITYAITNYKTEKTIEKKYRGSRIKASVYLYENNAFVSKTHDDVIFQDYGLTGLAILNLSNDISLILQKKNKPNIRIDLCDRFTQSELIAHLKKRVRTFKDRTATNLLLGIIHHNLIKEVLRRSGISENTISSKLSDKLLINLAFNIKHFNFTVKSIHSTDNAQVTVGGVDLNQLENELYSKKYPDIYFMGEVLDACGKCGGYNIQWAISSANRVCKSIKERYV